MENGRIIRLAGVFAHPDDDVYLIGGTLLRHQRMLDLTLIFATSGEAGPISDPSLATRETLSKVREGEQRRCLDILGYGDARVEFMHYPDYYLPEVPREQLTAGIQAVLHEVRPHIVVTFGPDGLTSHHDHIRVGEATSEAFHRERKTYATGDGSFQRLYCVALPRKDVDRFYAAVREGGLDYGTEGALFDITGISDDGIAVRETLEQVRARKLEGILAHRTQLVEWERIPEPLRWIYLDAEYFAQAYPPERPTRVRGDLFEELAV